MSNRVVGLNLGIAKEVGVNAALIFNELTFWAGKGTRGDKWVYKAYKEMLDRLPVVSERTIRRAYEALQEAGYVEFKVMKVDDTPTLHYRILRDTAKLAEPGTAKIAETRETANLAETSTNTLNNHKTTKLSRAEQDKKLLEIVNKITGRSFRTLPATGVAKTLQAFSFDEIEAALRNLVADEWHSERIKDLSLPYLIRSTTLDRFAGLPPSSATPPSFDEEARRGLKPQDGDDLEAMAREAGL